MTRLDCMKPKIKPGMKTNVVIMAGGVGSRLWPLSTPERPKQFIDLLGTGKSLIQLTMERFLPICSKEDFWVVTSERYAEEVARHLPDIPAGHILTEPQARNTAPCIAYASRKIASVCPDANVVVTPSDAAVLDNATFTAAISAALAHTSSSDSIVTLGITPSRPETGYGYIHCRKAVTGEVCKVEEFKEKPSLETAKKYLEDGNYLWNAGIFIWNIRAINDHIREYAPQIASVMDELEPSLNTPEEKERLAVLFPQCEKISIDFAVMEKASDIYVVPCNPQWSDLGTWKSVMEQRKATEEGNVVSEGDVRLLGCSDCIINVPQGGKIIIDGLKGYAVVRNGDDLLICPIENEQKIKDYLQSK